MIADKGYHFIGIGGIGMSGLARILLSQKMSVSGSDISINAMTESLVKEGALIYKGHSAGNIPEDARVIYSSDIRKDNPEFLAAVEKGNPLLHRSDLLAMLLNDKKALAVAGTHGKTTTSSLLATVLIGGDLKPSFAVGGVLPEFKTNAQSGEGEFFVLEADESDCSFLKYHPFGAIITNIGKDHLSSYGDSFDLLIDSFKAFMSQVKSSQHLFWCRDDEHLSELDIPGQTYGFNPESDWRVISMSQEGFSSYFDLQHKETLYPKIESSLIGRHNILNAAAVFGLAITLGIHQDSIRHALKNFKGVLRRCESKGSCNNVDFFDDYAHHPTEIKTTLAGIRQAIGARRLFVVFQPHRYSRTKDCMGLYGSIFNSADELIVTDIYAGGEAPIPNITADAIEAEVKSCSSINCCYVPRSALSHYLSQNVQPFDVVVTLGAGDVTKVSSETLVLLEPLAVS